jgi:hypothetical protein
MNEKAAFSFNVLDGRDRWMDLDVRKIDGWIQCIKRRDGVHFNMEQQQQKLLNDSFYISLLQWLPRLLNPLVLSLMNLSLLLLKPLSTWNLTPS